MNDVAKSAWGKVAMIRSVVATAALLFSISEAAMPGSAQLKPDLQTFFRQNLGLGRDQIMN